MLKFLKKYSPDEQHLGITFATEPNQEVRAIRDGTVVYSGSKMKSYGKMIIIKHAFRLLQFLHSKSIVTRTRR